MTKPRTTKWLERQWASVISTLQITPLTTVFFELAEADRETRTARIRCGGPYCWAQLEYDPALLDRNQYTSAEVRRVLVHEALHALHDQRQLVDAIIALRDAADATTRNAVYEGWVRHSMEATVDHLAHVIAGLIEPPGG